MLQCYNDSDWTYLARIPLSVGVTGAQEAAKYALRVSCCLEHVLAHLVFNYRNLHFLQDAWNSTTCLKIHFIILHCSLYIIFTGSNWARLSGYSRLNNYSCYNIKLNTHKSYFNPSLLIMRFQTKIHQDFE